MHSILSPAHHFRLYIYNDPGKLYPISSQQEGKYNTRYMLWKPIFCEYFKLVTLLTPITFFAQMP